MSELPPNTTGDRQQLLDRMVRTMGDLVMQAGPFVDHRPRLAERGMDDVVEAMRFRDTASILNGLGSEVKIVLLLQLWADQTVMTGRQQENDLIARTAEAVEPPRWIPERPDRYARNNFLPREWVLRGRSTAPNYSGAGYQFNPKYEDRLLPVLGLLADWSLRTEFTLDRLLGEAHSRGRFTGQETRATTILELATISGIGIFELCGLSFLPKISFTHMLAETAEQTWLNKEYVVVDNDSRYKVKASKSIPLPETIEANDEYKTIAKQFLQRFKVGQTFTYQQVLDYLIQNIEPKTDERASELRRFVHYYFYNMAGAFGFERMETYNRGFHYRLTLKEEYRQVIEELAQIILAIHEPNRYTDLIAYGRQRAEQIITDEPDSLAKLLNKHYDSSTQMATDPARSRNTILEILVDSEPLMAKELVDKLAQVEGRRRSLESVRVFLRDLVATGDVTPITKLVPTTTRKITHFAVRSQIE